MCICELECKIDTEKNCSGTRVVTYIDARHPTIGTVTDFRVHPFIPGKGKGILYLCIDARLTDELWFHKAGEVVTQRDVGDAQIIAILNEKIGELPVDVLFSHTGYPVAGTFTGPAAKDGGGIVGILVGVVPVRLHDLLSGSATRLNRKVETFVSEPEVDTDPEIIDIDVTD